MPKRIRLRELTTEEKAEIQRLAASRTEPFRLVQRATRAHDLCAMGCQYERLPYYASSLRFL